MSRPIKPRRVCHMPLFTDFSVINGNTKVSITLTVEEYEIIRLLDYLGFDQDRCALQMQISRGVVQQLYVSARKKIAQAITEGLHMKIEGGHYALCKDMHSCYLTDRNTQKNSCMLAKDKSELKILIAKYNGDEDEKDFSELMSFKFYDVIAGKVIRQEELIIAVRNETDFVEALKRLGIDVVFAFKMGLGYRNKLNEAGIWMYLGIKGKAEDVLQAFLNDTLTCDERVNCNYHTNREMNDYEVCAKFGGRCLLKKIAK